MNADRLSEILAAFSNARVLVVGDMFLDELRFGEMTGVSLESPVPVVQTHDVRYNPGAAGNVAANLAAMDARVCVVGVVGDDDNGARLRNAFDDLRVDGSGLVIDPSRPTNTYGKVLARPHEGPYREVLRTDTPTPPFVSGAVEDQLIAAIDARIGDVDAVVVIDQIASVASEPVIRHIASRVTERDTFAVADSRNRIQTFAGFALAMPNDTELGRAFGQPVETPEALRLAARRLLDGVDTALVTCGSRGMTGFEGERVFVAPSAAREVVDVTGAGDTATAAATLARMAGATLEESAHVANLAAGVAVGKPGVVTVTREEIGAHAQRDAAVLSRAELRAVCDRLKSNGKRIVWTNGCFDIIHAGHVRYLQRAAAEGDVLVVGLNSDASVKRVKGPDRPIVPEDERALILSALACVDYVTLFDDPSPAGIIEHLQPDV